MSVSGHNGDPRRVHGYSGLFPYYCYWRLRRGFEGVDDSRRRPLPYAEGANGK
jgi:hypothetical protein